MAMVTRPEPPAKCPSCGNTYIKFLREHNTTDCLKIVCSNLDCNAEHYWRPSIPIGEQTLPKVPIVGVGDTLVLQYKGPINSNTEKRIKESCMAVLPPGTKVLIVDAQSKAIVRDPLRVCPTCGSTDFREITHLDNSHLEFMCVVCNTVITENRGKL